MACRPSSSKEESTREPPKKRGKSSSCDVPPKITPKETLLQALKGVENAIKKHGDNSLRERLENLRGQVQDLLEHQEKENKNLWDEINSLKKEVENQKTENEKLQKELAVGEATQLFQAHLARFVVDSSEKIYPRGTFNQMEKYLRRLKNPTGNRWTEIQRRLTVWTDEHQEVVDNVKIGRDCKAHPYLTDLDLVESEIEETMSPDWKNMMKDMLDILKMTASLMKFGRLAKRYEWDRHLPLFHKARTRVLNEIISWDRNFEQIKGLQNIEHDDAKEYLTKYVSNRRTIDHYYFIVNFVRQGNSKRLGKLAWEFKESLPNLDAISIEHGEALEELQRLLPNPGNADNVTVLDYDIAKLHIPDFLPKRLWKHGIEIVENYETKVRI
jgi:hypothetical protein